MMIVPASVDTVQAVWPTYRHRSKVACDKVGISKFEDIERHTLNGNYLTWVVQDEDAIYGIVTLTRLDHACEIVTCTGFGIHKFLPLLEVLEQYARDNGMTVMRLYGRKGWIRILKDYTVMKNEKTYSILERPL